MNTEEKIRGLLELGRQRKADRLKGYRQVFEFHDGRYDAHSWVSPWTLSANNVDADLMLIAQDWTSEGALLTGFDERVELLGHTPELQTNLKVFEMLKNNFGLKFSETFATNLFPFVKPGEISAKVRWSALKYCAGKYAVPQIKMVSPKMAICLGSATSNAISYALGRKPRALREILKESVLFGDVSIFFAYHPGGLGTAGAGGAEAVDRHWRWLGEQYRQLLAPPSSDKEGFG